MGLCAHGPIIVRVRLGLGLVRVRLRSGVMVKLRVMIRVKVSAWEHRFVKSSVPLISDHTYDHFKVMIDKDKRDTEQNVYKKNVINADRSVFHQVICTDLIIMTGIDIKTFIGKTNKQKVYNLRNACFPLNHTY